MVTASFSAISHDVVVAVVGSGTIDSVPAGIACGTTCGGPFAAGTSLVLNAVPSAGWTFAGWSGACSGTGPCALTIAGDTAVTATFTPVTHALAVAFVGSGTVNSSPIGLACSADCSHPFAEGTSTTLSAAPSEGWDFAGWSGACSGVAVCNVTVAGATSVTANFTVSRRTLTVTKTGSGTVTSLPAGINCGADCTESYAKGTAVALVAMPGAGYQFAGWGGTACTGTGNCGLTMNAATTVNATFTPAAAGTFALNVAVQGSGSVSSTPAGIACGTDCSETYPAGTLVSLAPTPQLGATFVGWGGACSGAGACTVPVSATTTVTATFSQITHVLTVTKLGTGNGVVTSAPAGINCGADCSEAVAQGAAITLAAAPGTDSSFAGWGGACTGTGTCVVSVTAATTVTASFTQITHALTLGKSGTGTGAVTSVPAGINCGVDCSETFLQGTSVTLSAAAAAGSTFAGWTAAGCSGTSACVITMSAPTNVTAVFGLLTRRLTVTKSDAGSGTVTSAPAGINCGTDCFEDYGQGTSVTLTATAAVGSSFTGWSGGGCTGSGTCVVAMSAATTVTATFAPVMRSLTVAKAGTGSGTVASSPPGISCGTDCSEPYAQGTSVTLTATPSAGSAFGGWSGGSCSGTGTCVVAVNAATTVTATFTQILRTLTVTVVGAGGVGSTPSGISCPSDCTEGYAQGTSVLLVATPSAGQQFTGWSGGCSGTGSCTVTMDAATSVTATFAAAPGNALNVVVAGAGTGAITSAPAGISCPGDCTETYAVGVTSVTLTATSTGGSTFAGWSGGGCSGTATTCSVPLSSATTVTATFGGGTAVGLTTRPNNTTCMSFDPPTSSTASLSLPRAFVSLSFSEPVALLQAPGDSSRWFVVEKAGRVRVFANNAATTSTTLFLDITSRITTAGELEAGLLGMAFDPNFGTGAGKNQYVYLFYSGAPNSGYRLRSKVSRFQANAATTSVDVATEVSLLGLDKLESNHNGGQIAFGPDGLLYIGFGDGGGDPNPQAQDDKYLFGKMIRIDTGGSTAGVPYSIPADNPNAGNALCNATGRGNANCPEVWARGLRNPWRWSFDKLNGRLWVGDVGWGSFEEVNIVTRGANYGWPLAEGNCTANCTGLTNPVYAVARGDGQSITGGYVYRGTQSTDLLGQYIFADFGSKMFGAVITGASAGTYTARQLIAPFSSNSIMPSSFAEALDGELYALAFDTGFIHKLVFSAGSSGSGPNVPALLSATGCTAGAGSVHLPAPGMVGYDINASFWSDNAVKQRYFALPNSTASFTPDSGGDWTTPLRSVFRKDFRLAGQLVETRLFMRQSNGDWAGYSYEWNAGQTDATLVGAAGIEKSVAGQTWSYPSRSQCMQCHTSAAGFSLGLETQQMNRSTFYPQTGITAHQLTTLSAPQIAMLTPPITDPTPLPRLSDPAGADSLDLRARAWLHTNCSMCHRPGGPTPLTMNLQASVPLASTNTCGQDPARGGLGLPNPKIIAAGLPDSSVLLARINSRDPAIQMPPIGSHVVDTAGVALLRAWITNLGTCN